ncbi:hypothetical protein FSP39_000907 [Pinctada imbricata]|uniref:Saccharopine dehydrogenase-like C-terminal domain-containing protein n=1 Tax=Pinctada imbricata TaxID=66713 RepID=A0AA88Y1X4_PINIB|nr:hypothetical protein FSP39_000907 [Pinctada imbricata]
MEQTSFSMTFVAKGWKSNGDQDSRPDTINVTKLVGPEPGYVTTPICFVQAAVVLLKEGNKLPADGGVYTPGSAFQDTSLIKRLNDHHMVFSKVTQ